MKKMVLMCLMVGLLSTMLTKPCRSETQTLNKPIQIESGLLRGAPNADGSVTAFKGIPYAKPPVGELRWKAPQPPLAWSGVRQADRFGATCPQPPNPGIVLTVPQSEDCLTLNVWTPIVDPNARRPVMVWIHGGSLTMGSGSEPTYDGQFLATRGAVVVTINYRLGHLGFFAHPALEAEAPNGPVNFGLYDQRAALQWVQDNIAAFGGDPQKVTIFGESAGATSVLTLFASPLTRGLFHRGIVMSYPQPSSSRDQEIAEGVTIASALGLAGAQATIAELRAVPVEQFAAHAYGKRPVMGDPFLPQSIVASFQNGDEAPVPLIIGNTSDDASPFVSIYDLSAMSKKYEAAGIAVKELYPGVADESELGRYVFRDAIYTTAVKWLTTQHARHAPAWQYYFSYLPVNARSTMPGVPHGFELQFVFGTLEQVAPPGMLMPEDLDMSRRVMDYWYAFAATGKPEPAGMPAWPVTDAQHDQTMIFGETITVQPNFMEKQVNAYLKVLPKNSDDFWAIRMFP